MWIQISSGRGPIECSRAVLLFSMELIKEIEAIGYRADAIDIEEDIESGTAKSILISTNIESNNKYLLDIKGTILWINKSNYRENHKRKNWYIDIIEFTEPDLLLFSDKDIKDRNYEKQRCRRTKCK